MNFGQAIEILKSGGRVARAGWNGKGMWLALTPGATLNPAVGEFRGAAALVRAVDDPSWVVIGAHIDMRAADGSLVIGWLASQTDMLAEDWTEVK